jgi:hypothetical protein
MPRRAAAAPLDATIVKVRKGEAQPHAAPPPHVTPTPRASAPAENRIGITVRFPESVHERLRVLAFERRTSKQALIEAWVAEQLVAK